MFRHKITTTDEVDKSPSSQEGVGGVAEVGSKNPPTSEVVKPEPSLKELIEKNLKWSQIIYEQNRKINNKLLWAGILSWLKLIIVVGSIVWAFIYLQPVLKNVWGQYSALLGGASSANGAPNQSSLNNLLQMFNLDPAKQAQLKALLK